MIPILRMNIYFKIVYNLYLFYPIIRIKLKIIKISYRLRNLNRFEYFQILLYHT